MLSISDHSEILRVLTKRLTPSATVMTEVFAEGLLK